MSVFRKHVQNSLNKYRDETEKSEKSSFRMILINFVCCLPVKIAVVLLAATMLASTMLASPPPNQSTQTCDLSVIKGKLLQKTSDHFQTCPNNFVHIPTAQQD